MSRKTSIYHGGHGDTAYNKGIDTVHGFRRVAVVKGFSLL